MRDRLSVLHVTAPGAVGGLETVVQGLACGLRERGHDVQVAAVVQPEAAQAAFFEPLRAAGVPVHRIVLPARAYLRERRAVRDLCRRLRPDVVHTHGYRTDILDAPVARKEGSATITTLHGSSMMAGDGERESFFEWLQLRVLPRFDGVVAVSEELEERLAREGVPGERIHPIPNAWSPLHPPLERGMARRELGISGTRPVIGFVGRLIRVKGPDVLLRAAAGLPDASVSVVGDGVFRARLEELAAELGLSGRVAFHGEVEAAARLHAAFDVFALSSRSEGTPVALLEAIAAGVPVVASAVGGVPDVLGEDGGWLVPPGDPGALEEALREALDDRRAAAARAAVARRRLERHFSSGTWLDLHEAAYRQCRERRRTIS